MGKTVTVASVSSDEGMETRTVQITSPNEALPSSLKGSVTLRFQSPVTDERPHGETSGMIFGDRTAYNGNRHPEESILNQEAIS